MCISAFYALKLMKYTLIIYKMSTPSTSTSATVPAAEYEFPTGLHPMEADYITPAGQNYALVSFVGPEFCRQKSNRFALKVRGVFATPDEAKAYVNRLRRAGDTLVDIFLLEIGRWAPCPPDPMQLETQEYQETFLNELMQGYAESQQQAKEMFNDRKERVMRDGLDKHLLPEERLPPPPTNAIPAPEKMPKMEITSVDEPAETAETPKEPEPTATEATDNVFNADDPWTARHRA
ncbi:hypothetical protein ATCVBr0604L_050L [Acanthocystis turfacea Chlorella virus Br0604L]|nr:hypothetical protein ATCVBr0604L_050L [Acanthocystis turfacea Chlorella virus Br0604L]